MRDQSSNATHTVPTSFISIPDMQCDDGLSRTAAHAVFDIADLRGYILRLLPRSAQARYLRLQWRCFHEGVQVLYKKIAYERIREVTLSPRANHYARAVREIDVRSNPNKSEGAIYRKDAKAWSELAPTILSVVLPDLRRQFPALRKVHFGSVDGLTWAVRLNAGYGVKEGYHGHIDLVVTSVRTFDKPLYRAYAPYFSPLPNYSLSTRFDLVLFEDTEAEKRHMRAIEEYAQYQAYASQAHSLMFGHPQPPPCVPIERRTQLWLTALRECRGFVNLHHRIDLSILKVDLSDLTELYQAQADGGRPDGDRLQKITAPACAPFDIYDFATFSSIASRSLITLNLGRTFIPTETSISFYDLPSITDIILNSLTNLEKISLVMRGVEEAEEVCRSALSERALDGGGYLRELRIEVGTHALDSILFNTIRYLSRVCRPNASIRISSGKDESYVRVPQSNYLKYLRSQSSARRKHLGHVNFATLGISTIEQVSDLKYDKEDRPVSRSMGGLA